MIGGVLPGTRTSELVETKGNKVVSGKPPVHPTQTKPQIPKAQGSHPSDPLQVSFAVDQKTHTRLSTLTNRFPSFGSPEATLKQLGPEAQFLIDLAKKHGGHLSVKRGFFTITVNGNQVTMQRIKPDATVQVTHRRNGSLDFLVTGDLGGKKGSLSGTFWKGQVTVGEAKASNGNIGLAVRGHVAQLPPCSFSFAQLPLAMQQKLEPALRKLGIKPSEAWVYSQAMVDHNGCHMELGVMKRNPGGGYQAFGVTGDQGWGGLCKACLEAFKKKLLPEIIKCAPKLGIRLAGVVPGVGNGITAFEAGWTIGRKIGQMKILGKTVDQHMQDIFLSMMRVQG